MPCFLMFYGICLEGFEKSCMFINPFYYSFAVFTLSSGVLFLDDLASLPVLHDHSILCHLAVVTRSDEPFPSLYLPVDLQIHFG